MKKCSKCGIEKGESSFYRNLKGLAGLSAACKACQDEYSKAYKEKYAGSVKAYQAAYQAAYRARKAAEASPTTLEKRLARRNSKRCCGCGHEKGKSEFFTSPSKKGLLSARCKPCHSKYMKEYKEKNAEAISAQRKMYAQTSAGKASRVREIEKLRFFQDLRKECVAAYKKTDEYKSYLTKKQLEYKAYQKAYQEAYRAKKKEEQQGKTT